MDEVMYYNTVKLFCGAQHPDGIKAVSYTHLTLPTIA